MIISNSHAATALEDSDPVTAVAVIASMSACCGSEAWPEAEHILERELKALGLRVQVVPSKAREEGDRRRELQELTRVHQAACAVRMVRPTNAQGRVEVWVEDRVTHKMLFRQLRVESDGSGRDAGIVALRAVEMLRASLLELQLEDSAPGKNVPPAVRQLAELPAPHPRTFPVDILVQGGLWFSSGGAPQMFQVQMGAHWHPWDFLRLGITGGLSPIQSQIRDSGMSASFQVGDVLLWGFWEPPSFSPIVRAALGAGAGAMFVRTQGTASAPGLSNRTDSAFVGAGAIRFDLRLRLAPRIDAVLSVSGGFAIPEITVRFSDRIAATAGNPFAQMLAGLEMRAF